MKVVKVYFKKHEALIAEGLLRDAGIEVIVSSDDAGGYRQHLTFGMGNNRVMVQDSDFERAQEILEVLDKPIDEQSMKEMEETAVTTSVAPELPQKISRNAFLFLAPIIVIFLFVLSYVVKPGGKPKTENKDCRRITGTNVGVCREFYINGKPRREDQYIINGPYDGPSMRYFPTGQIESEASFRDGKREGAYKHYFENGQLQWQANYEGGKLQGEAIEYYESGKLKRIATYKDNNINGSVRTYFENEKLMAEWMYIDGKRVNEEGIYFEGIDKTFYENGNLWEERNFHNGVRDGLGKEYFESGQLKFDANYRNDECNGLYRVFYEDGTLKSETNFSNNIPIKVREYDRSGKLIFKADN